MAEIVARLVLNLHDDGSLSVSGNIGDKALAVGMLDAARAAVDGLKPHAGLIVPARDVAVTPDERRFPLGDVVRA